MGTENAVDALVKGNVSQENGENLEMSGQLRHVCATESN